MGACVAFNEIIPKNPSQSEISPIVDSIRSSGVHVILVFAVEQDVAAFFDEVVRYDILNSELIMFFCLLKLQAELVANNVF